MQLSPNDHKKYQQVVLDNKLKVLLIEDPSSQVSAAALAVRVGHFDDPIHRQGFAHFLEHMLFLGTQKYPKIGEFQDYIHQHGGQNNAWTGTEHTCFFFDIHADFFQTAIDRFSQFFIAPLFHADALDKERHAIESEFQLKLTDEQRRIYQVHKELINPDHPFAKFSVGNLKTLSDGSDGLVGTRQELIDFYQQNYSSDLMTLTLSGPQSIETLNQLAHQFFSPIVNRNYQGKSILEPLWLNENHQLYVHVQPKKQTRRLILAFLFPSVDDFYQTKPLSYFAHLIGDESPNSLYQYLKSEQLILSLSAGGGIGGSNFREFTISCTLTEKGLIQKDKVIEIIFYYLELIKKSGLERWRYDEKKSVLETAFQFQESSKLIDLTCHLAMNQQLYQKDDIVYGDYMMTHYDKTQLDTFLNRFTPAHLRVMLIHQNGEFNQRAKWYQTPYQVTSFSSEQLKAWSNPAPIEEISLPKKNPYIANHMIPNQIPLPVKEQIDNLESSPGFCLWHRQDETFQVPKGLIYVAIDSPHAVSSVENIVKTKLCVEIFLDALNQETYQAEIAGMSYHLYTHQGGVTLILSGFTQKQAQLLEVITQKFSARQLNQDRFTSIKDQLIRYWKNQLKDRPISQLMTSLTGLLQPNNPPTEEKLLALKEIQPQSLVPFVGRFLSQLHIEMFVYGHWQKDEAIKLAQSLKKTLKVENQTYKESLRPLVLLGEKGSFVYQKQCLNQQDSAIVIYYQASSISIALNAIYMLAHHLMSAAFFHELRTKQQLGYMVGSAYFPLNQYAGLIMYIQSPHTEPKKLLDAIDEFLNALYLVLLELSEEKWQHSKQGLLNQLNTPASNLNTKGQRLWHAISHKDYQLTQREELYQQVSRLTKEQMIAFIVKELKPRTANRLIVYSKGEPHQESENINLGNTIQTIKEFQRLPQSTDLG